MQESSFDAVFSDELDRLTSIIESQAVTIETLSLAPRYNSGSSVPFLNQSLTPDSQLVIQYRGMVSALNKERDILVGQVHEALMAVEDGQPRSALEKRFFSAQIKRLEQLVQEQTGKIERMEENEKTIELQVEMIGSLKIEIENLKSKLTRTEAKNAELVQLISEFEQWKIAYDKLSIVCNSLQKEQASLNKTADEFGKKWQSEVQIRQKLVTELDHLKIVDQERRLEIAEKDALSIF